MLNFIIEVSEFGVSANETAREINNPDAVAMVDGERWNYRVQKNKNYKPKGRRAKVWRERAMNYVHYHANNSGERVRFEHVGSKRTTRKKKISEQQRSMF